MFLLKSGCLTEVREMGAGFAHMLKSEFIFQGLYYLGGRKFTHIPNSTATHASQKRCRRWLAGCCNDFRFLFFSFCFFSAISTPSLSSKKKKEREREIKKGKETKTERENLATTDKWGKAIRSSQTTGYIEPIQRWVNSSCGPAGEMSSEVASELPGINRLSFTLSYQNWTSIDLGKNLSAAISAANYVCVATWTREEKRKRTGEKWDFSGFHFFFNRQMWNRLTFYYFWVEQLPLFKASIIL